MPLYNLLIKGSKQDAFNHTSIRNIPSVFIAEGDGIVTCHTNAPLEDLQKWFCEEPTNPPFPIGTLLFYSEVNSNEKAS